VAVSTIAAVIALTAGIALLIGWYRGFSIRSLELAAAVFVVILAFQIVVLVVIGGDIGPDYWLIAGAVAVGWVACVWVGSRARGMLER
jgi:CBS domain containing-hemolysin-like protein